MNNSRRVLLVNPLIREKNVIEIFVEYLGIDYLAAYLRNYGYDVDIIDAYISGDSIDEIVQLVFKGNYPLVGFTVMSSDYFKNVKAILQKVKNRNEALFKSTKFVIGGYFATIYQEELLEECELINYLVYGEGEYSLLALANSISDGDNEIDIIPNLIYRKDGIIVKNPSAGLIEQIDDLPFPARDTLRQVLNNNGNASISTSRGCYGKCDYCAVYNAFSSFKGAVWRARNFQNVVDEIEKLTYDYQIKYINFIDEDFIGPGKKGKTRALNIAEEIIKRGIKINFHILTRSNNIEHETIKALKNAGLERAFLGIEFGNQRMLDFYNKKTTVEQNIKALCTLKDLEVDVTCGYIMFEPLMSMDEFRQNFKFYMKYVPEFNPKSLVSRLHIYPKSKVYEKLKDKISIEARTEFHPVLGSYHRYMFKNAGIYIILQALSELLEDFTTYNFEKKLIEMDKEKRNLYFKKAKSIIGNEIEMIIDYVDGDDVLKVAKELPKYIKERKNELTYYLL